MAKYFIAPVAILAFIVLAMSAYEGSFDWMTPSTPPSDSATASFFLKQRGDGKIEVRYLSSEGIRAEDTSLTLGRLQKPKLNRPMQRGTTYDFNEERLPKGIIIIEPGLWTFRVGNSAITPSLASTTRTVNVREGESRELHFELRRPKRYTLRFVDEEGAELPAMTRRRPDKAREARIESIDPNLNYWFRMEPNELPSFEAFGGEVAIAISNGRYIAGASNRYVVDLEDFKGDVITVPCVRAGIQLEVLYGKFPMPANHNMSIRWPLENRNDPPWRVLRQVEGLAERIGRSYTMIRPGRYVLEVAKLGADSSLPPEHPECEIVISDYSTKQVWEWRGLKEGFVRLQ